MRKYSGTIRFITTTAIFSAVATVLMLLDTSIPLMPSFIKLDISDMPALLASFTSGPISGIIVCLIKNLINILSSATGAIGELSNFILGVFFVVPAGIIYKKKRTFKSALLGSMIGAVSMTALSLLSNYYIIYPIYTRFMPMEAIISAYQAINPAVKTLWDALIWFNVPFTFLKCLLSIIIVFLIYKRLSNFIKKKF